MPNKQRRLVLPALAAAAVTVTAMSIAPALTKAVARTSGVKEAARAVRPGEDGVTTTFEASIPASPLMLTAQAQGEALYRPTYRVQVHKDSLRPDIIHASPGKVILDAGNETEGEVSLAVERVREQGQPRLVTGKVKVRGGRKRAKQELELGAGEYLVYDEARPEIRGRIIVEPQ